MKNQGIQLSWIVVKDLKSAIKFYTETVGLSVQEECPEFGWAELTGPSGCILGIAEESKEENVKAGSNAIMTISVENLETACAFFKKKGVHLIGDVLEIPECVKMQTFKDADGNTMQLVEKL